MEALSTERAASFVVMGLDGDAPALPERRVIGLLARVRVACADAGITARKFRQLDTWTLRAFARSSGIAPIEVLYAKEVSDVIASLRRARRLGLRLARAG